MCVLDDSKWGILHENKGLGETFVKNKPVCQTFRRHANAGNYFLFFNFIYINI